MAGLSPRRARRAALGAQRLTSRTPKAAQARCRRSKCVGCFRSLADHRPPTTNHQQRTVAP
eukprot:5982322-Alexandrium_andersonii.AAC.1